MQCGLPVNPSTADFGWRMGHLRAGSARLVVTGTELHQLLVRVDTFSEEDVVIKVRPMDRADMETDTV